MYIHVYMYIMRFDCGGDDVHHVNPCYDADCNKLQTPSPASFYRLSSPHQMSEKLTGNTDGHFANIVGYKSQDSGVKIQ